MKKYIPHILGAIFVLVKKLIFTYHVDVAPKENTWIQVPMLLIFVDRQYERDQVELQSDFMTDISGTWQVRAFDDMTPCLFEVRIQ